MRAAVLSGLRPTNCRIVGCPQPPSRSRLRLRSRRDYSQAIPLALTLPQHLKAPSYAPQQQQQQQSPIPGRLCRLSSSASPAALPTKNRAEEEEEEGVGLDASYSPSAPTVRHVSPYGHARRRSRVPDNPLPEWLDPAHAGRLTAEHPVLPLRHYGNWRELLYDCGRLMVESGLGKPAPSAGLAVDRRENWGDIELWSAILNFAHRRHGHYGAWLVWKRLSIWGDVRQTEGPVARAFWRTIVECALEDEAFLDSTWAYAERLLTEHGVLWPHYYSDIVSFFLKNEQYARAIRWHVRLSARLSGGKAEFFGVLKAFITDADPQMQEALQSMYATSAHRMLYDAIIPLLWSEGLSGLARSWRDVLVRYGDKPTSGASLPFLKFLAGYYPEETDFCAEERDVLGKSLEAAFTKGVPSAEACHTPMSRWRGNKPGVREKAYSDKMIARWLATNWVSLDTAIHTIYALGVSHIGPLSLQAIGLREDSAAGVRYRLRQLEMLRISTGQTVYVKAIRYLAMVDDFETLRGLLDTDLHPDVFEDVSVREVLIGEAPFQGDWKTYRMLLSVDLAMSGDSIVAATNALLASCLEKRQKVFVLKLLDEMSARRVEIFPSTIDSISRLILDEGPAHFDPGHSSDLNFYIALARRVVAMHLPIASEAWRNILLVLGQQGRFDAFTALAFDLVHDHLSFQSSGETASRVHILDVPRAARDAATLDSCYCFLPRDLPLRHPSHPLARIFDRHMIASVVHWFFRRQMVYRQTAGVRGARNRDRARPSEFHAAGGIRLLRMLRDLGLEVPAATVRNQALVCLAVVFAQPHIPQGSWRVARHMNQLMLREVKALCDDAWGGELLPPAPALRRAIEAARAAWVTAQQRGSKRSDCEAFLVALFGAVYPDEAEAGRISPRDYPLHVRED